MDEEKASTDFVEGTTPDEDKPQAVSYRGRLITGFDADTETAPEGYLWSVNLWGSLTAIGMSFGSAVGQFALAAPILSIINDDIGPSPNVAWISYVAVLGIAVSLPITARYTDVFGRRNFIIVEQFIMAIGSVVGATAQTVPWLIGATAIMSSFSGGAYSYSYLANEILPMKYRFMSTGFCIIFAVPFSGFAPEIALTVAQSGAGGAYGGWRWVYWLMAILNIVSTLLLFIFYHPPTFKMKHHGESKLQIIKQIDYIGISIFAAGIVVFILGLSWGGTAYPWDSAAVIVSIVGGAAALAAFFLWEKFGRVKQPFVPLHLFNDRDWLIGTLMLSFGASIYYAFALVWPQAVAALYSDPSKPQIRAILSCCAAIPYNGGQITGNGLCKKIGKLKLQLIVACSVGTVFYGCLAAIPADDRASTLGLLIVGTFCFGWNEGVTQTLVGICVNNQKEIGIAVGAAGSIRSVISTIWSSIFVTVLDNRLKTTLPAAVGPVAINAGLPSSSVPALLEAFQAGTSSAFAKVPGLTPAIRAAVTQAYKVGSVKAYHTVYEVSVAVGGTLAVLAIFAPNVDHLMNDKIAVTVHRKREEKELEAEAEGREKDHSDEM